MQEKDQQGSTVLDRLSGTERDVLRLLGQGHTAKSIAALRGLTVAAVNERLRSGRRKTGVGSSRELARLLAAQENRDDFIGLAAAPAAPPGSPRPGAAPSRQASFFRRWSLPMIAAGLIAAAALFAQQTATPPAAAPTDRGQPLVPELLSHQQQAPDMAALHAEAAGAPDPEWSAQTEALLSQRYRAIIGEADGLASFGVTCSAVMCEVAGTTRLDVAGEQVAGLLARLQNVATADPIPGLEHRLGHYGSSPARPGAFVFVSYWRRT